MSNIHANIICQFSVQSKHIVETMLSGTAYLAQHPTARVVVPGKFNNVITYHCRSMLTVVIVLWRCCMMTNIVVQTTGNRMMSESPAVAERGKNARQHSSQYLFRMNCSLHSTSSPTIPKFRRESTIWSPPGWYRYSTVKTVDNFSYFLHNTWLKRAWLTDG